MKKLLFITVLFTVIGFSSTAFSQTPCDYNTKGLKEIADSNYRQALADFNLALQYCSDNQDSLIGIYLNRSWAEFALGEYKKTIEDDSIATDLNIKLGSRYLLKTCYFGIGDIIDLQLSAICSLDMALDYYKNNKQITERLSYYVGQVSFNLHQYTDAIGAYSTCIAVDSNNRQVLRQRGEAYKRNNQYQLAVNDFNRAIPYYANDTASLIQLYSSLGRSLFKLNNFNDALNAYNHSFSLNPKDSEAYLSITNCYEKLGNYYKAAANCEVGISRWNTNTSMLSLFYSILGNSLPYIGKTGESIEAFNHAISLKSGDPYLYSFRAISYDDTFDYKQAIKDYKSAISLYKDDDNDRLSNWYNNKGIDERLLAKYKNAVKDELKAIAVKPAYAGAYLELGRTYQLMNKKKQAEAAFKKSVQFDSSGSYIFIDAFFLGDSAVAVKTITDKIHSDPVGNLNYDYYTAACLNVLMNKPNEAIMYLKEGMAAGLSKYFVMYDPYFRSIRYTPAFIALMKE